MTEDLTASGASAAQPTVERMSRGPRLWLAALLNLVPGLGSLYAGAWRQAIALPLVGILLAWSAALLMARAPGAPWNVVLPAAALATWPVAVLVLGWRAARRARGQPLHRRPRFLRWSRSRRIAALAAFLAAALAISELNEPLLRRAAGKAYRIPSEAMAPTIEMGDYILATDLGTDRPARGEPVVYRFGDKEFVHRIAGVEGDTLAMRAGLLWRNGAPVVEPYARQVTGAGEITDSTMLWQLAALAPGADRGSYVPKSRTWGPLVVPAGHVFVLGDNRDNSLDSRYTGFVAEDDLVRRPRRIYYSWDPDASRVRWARIGRDVR